ncbi:2-oxoacid:acceptor oxidoreductase family protein [Selenomonadales bacterium OttesenSCG-928-I06]|nr:2-oxoacid:acceptor oxidoreductase family protein [Selenomonadales bacterium OttesenSCG-928-I06]
MANLIKIAIAGEGGQGVQSIAEILAEAANEAGKNALYIPNFGVEQRGGVSIAYVQISDEAIGFPKFQKADILIPVSTRAVERTAMYAGKDTIYIYDNSLVDYNDVNKEVVGNKFFDVTPANLGTDNVAVNGDKANKNLSEVNTLIAIPANDIAKNELHPRVFNIIILGAVIAATEVLPLDRIKEALESKLGAKFEANPKLREMNFNALERGYELIKGAIK